MAINALGLYGHITDPLIPGAIPDPLLKPTYPLSVCLQFTPQELSNFKEWWGSDGQVQHILTSCLDMMVLASIPQTIPNTGQRQSSCDIYAWLCILYSAGDYHSAMNIEMKLHNLECRSMTSPQGLPLQDYIATWRSSTTQMLAAGYPLPPHQLLQLFVNGLPNNVLAFIPLQNEVLVRLNNSDDNSLPTLEDVMENVVNPFLANAPSLLQHLPLVL
ncbi:hypothetical protein CVT25_000121 [Psilocybe cyanescens]|uniref:Uncharacterized protein n=1 Tax=Psilocybe cyanescens TaxID=93625 RepID=A0A409XFA9_PSICY|nr:hypothetical protein CVT25_000121 [Psilocybe cyanescens]